MKISDRLVMLELSVEVMGVQRVIRPTLMWDDDDDVVLVDAGVPSTLGAIRQQVETSGAPSSRLNHVILTQQDIDHSSGVRGLRDERPDLIVHAHEEDAPYIQGEKRVRRHNEQFLQRISDRPEAERRRIVEMFENSRTRVDRFLYDGQVLPFCGGVTVIHTPGHTPGHVCLYHHASRTLIAGDALNILHGELVGPNEDPMAEDGVVAADAIDALKKLLNYDIANIVTYHGGLFDDDPNASLRDVIRLGKLYSYQK